MTPQQARTYGRRCASAFPDRDQMGRIASEFLAALPPKPDTRHMKAREAKAAALGEWAKVDRELRAAWADGETEAKGRWPQMINLTQQTA